MTRCNDEGVPFIVQDVWCWNGGYKATLFDKQHLEFFDYEVACLLGKPLSECSQELIHSVVEVLAEREYWSKKKAA